MTPELENIHPVDAAHGILWTIGLKDILRFDGKRWERIDFPGNDPGPMSPADRSTAGWSARTWSEALASRVW